VNTLYSNNDEVFYDDLGQVVNDLIDLHWPVSVGDELTIKEADEVRVPANTLVDSWSVDHFLERIDELYYDETMDERGFVGGPHPGADASLQRKLQAAFVSWLREQRMPTHYAKIANIRERKIKITAVNSDTDVEWELI
jgi:hypothetical protein